jgi:hypothetical protein
MEGFEIGVEAPEVDLGGGADEGAEVQEDVQDTPEGDSPEGEPEGEDPSDKPAGPLVQDGKLSPAARAALDKLKAENPALAKSIQKALFAEDRLRRELPGGFKEVQQLRQRIEELGGDDGIKDTQQELSGWREFDNLYTAGDAAVLKFLTDTPAAQAAFLKIAPMAFEKFREASPDGFASYISQAFLGDWEACKIPLILERLTDFIPEDNAKAMAYIQSLKNYDARIREMAQKQPEAPKVAPKDDGRVAELEKRETALLRQEWGNEIGKLHTPLFQKAWKAVLGDRKLSDVQKEGIRELYASRLQAAIKERQLDDKLNRFFGAKDKAGYLKFMTNFYTEMAPKALRSAMEHAGIGAKTGPKPGVPGVPKPGVQAPAKPDQGFVAVNAKPNFFTEVDRVRTTPQMLANHQAILKNGRKVQWPKG